MTSTKFYSISQMDPWSIRIICLEQPTFHSYFLVTITVTVYQIRHNDDDDDDDDNNNNLLLGGSSTSSGLHRGPSYWMYIV